MGRPLIVFSYVFEGYQGIITPITNQVAQSNPVV